MEDAFVVIFDTRAIKDLKAFSREVGRHLLHEINAKLSASPLIFGKPLRHSLRGHRALRVGDYRAVFRISAREVLVVAIVHRSSGYGELEARIDA